MSLLDRKSEPNAAEATPAEVPNHRAEIYLAVMRLVGVFTFGVTTLATAFALAGLPSVLTLGLALVTGGCAAYAAMILSALAIVQVES